jgi:uncharacterized BrkB/YihY/UPF0761 family membrane protein
LNSVPRKFGKLRFIGSFFRVMGVIIVVVTIVAAILLAIALPIGGSVLGNLVPTSETPERLYSYGILSGVVTALLVMVVGSLWGALTFGLGEMFYVLIAIEENTRSIQKTLED